MTLLEFNSCFINLLGERPWEIYSTCLCPYFAHPYNGINNIYPKGLL